MSESIPDRSVDEIRAFSRFYTARLGVLGEGLLDSPYSLAEARVLFELGAQGGGRRAPDARPSAADLARRLDLDPGYLSRILGRFQRAGLLRREPSREDGRRSDPVLTAAGRRTLAGMERRSRSQARTLLRALTPEQRSRLGAAMAEVRDLLGDPAWVPAPAVIRTHRPGDMGWIVQRHAEIYTREFGWDGSFEAVVAEIATGFIRDFEPGGERCWIAEIQGRRAGSICLVRRSETVAKLRLLLLEPESRGRGLGRQLLETCLGFARECGYREVELWTMSNLTAARALYASAGFTLSDAQPSRAFGHELVEETWRLVL